MTQMFEGPLKPSREPKSGYAETYADWVDHAMISDDDLLGGPCKIDHSKNALPVCEKIISSANEIISPLFELGCDREQ